MDTLGQHPQHVYLGKGWSFHRGAGTAAGDVSLTDTLFNTKISYKLQIICITF